MTDQARTDDPAFGFWSLTWRSRDRLLSWDLGATVLAGVLVGLLTADHTLHGSLPGLLYAEIAVLGALMGLVVAGLAIIAAFINRDMVLVLQQLPGGLDGEFFPFMFVAVLCLAGIVLDMAFLLTDLGRQHAPVRLAAVMTTMVFVYAITTTVNLVGGLIALGSNRGRQLALLSED